MLYLHPQTNYKVKHLAQSRSVPHETKTNGGMHGSAVQMHSDYVQFPGSVYSIAERLL